MVVKKWVNTSLKCCVLCLACQGVAIDLAQAESDVGYNVPAPKMSVNYRPHDYYSYGTQGNNFLSVPAQVKETKEVEGLPPLFPSEEEALKAQQPANEAEQRLADYDKQFAELEQISRDQMPLGNLINAEELYANIPRSSEALYLRDQEDFERFRRGLVNLEQMTEGEIGFVVFDDKGPVVIYNNSDFPLIGFSNFHLAYGVADRMQRLHDKIHKQLSFNIKDLKPDVFSPLTEFLMQSVGHRVAQSSGLDKTMDNTSIEQTSSIVAAATRNMGTAQERADALAMIAAAMRKGTIHTHYERQLEEMRRYNQKVVQKSEEDNALTMEQYKTEGRRNALDIATLLYFSLAFSDINASDILVDYMGNLKSLDLFIRRQGMIRSKYKVPDSLSYLRPDSSYMNRGPLFDTARSYVRYLQDKTLSPDVRSCIDEIMYFNHSADQTIQKGIQKSIKNASADDRYSLKIYSCVGVGGINVSGKRVIVSDMSYIQYKGQRYLMVIAVKDIPGRDVQSRIQGENIIAFIANALFNYLKTTSDQSTGSSSNSSSSLLYDYQ